MENKKEYNIGEIFQCGLLYIQCIQQRTSLGVSCKGCMFHNSGTCVDDIEEIVGYCDEYHRSDNKNVIFVKCK